MSDSFTLRAGVLYRFQFAADPDFELVRPQTDEYHALVSEMRDGIVELRGQIRCPVDGELRVSGYLWGNVAPVDDALPH